jgi:hypothetical protein
MTTEKFSEVVRETSAIAKWLTWYLGRSPVTNPAWLSDLLEEVATKVACPQQREALYRGLDVRFK